MKFNYLYILLVLGGNSFSSDALNNDEIQRSKILSADVNYDYFTKKHVKLNQVVECDDHTTYLIDQSKRIDFIEESESNELKTIKLLKKNVKRSLKFIIKDEIPKSFTFDGIGLSKEPLQYRFLMIKPFYKGKSCDNLCKDNDLRKQLRLLYNELGNQKKLFIPDYQETLKSAHYGNDVIPCWIVNSKN